MYQHDVNTEARSQTRALTTLRLSTYSHSHYSDEPNKEMHSFIYTTACYTYSKHKNKPNRDMTMPNLRKTIANLATGICSVPNTYKSKLHPCTDLTNTCTLQHKKTNKHKLN